MKKRDLTSEETDLWRRTTRDVKKLDSSPGLIPDIPVKKADRLKERLSDARPTALHTTAAPRAYAPVAGASAKKKNKKAIETVVGAGDPLFDKRVSRRRMPIDRTLDLHGMTQVAAEVALRAFLAQAARDGLRCVLVITGKGGGPTSRGVLHNRFSDWVNDESLQRFIARVAPAHQKDGGGGAWYVFLKGRR